MHPDLSIIIVSFNTREVLRQCLHSLYAAIGQRPAEVIVIDNASRDQSAEMVAQDFPLAHLVRSQSNLGFAAANNVGFALATGRYVVLLNPDAQLDADALDRAVRFMDVTPNAGMLGARLVDERGVDQPSARQFPSLLNELLTLSGLAARFPQSRLCGRFDRTWADPAQAAPVDWVPGAFAVIRHAALRSVGGFDERFFLYYEEVDLCRRFAAAQWEIWYRPEIVVKHIGGVSSKTVKEVEFSSSGSQLVLWRMRSALLYYRKHHGQLGAWLLSRLEIAWHALRQWKARHVGQQPSSAAKAAESGRLVALMRRAWGETQGGAISPPRPW